MDIIKLIIADDNKVLTDFIIKQLNQHADIDILGVACSDKEEIKMIEELKPEIVISDLMRDGEYSGLEIIKKYSPKEDSPKFLILSADVITPDIFNLPNVLGYIQKINMDCNKLYNEIKLVHESKIHLTKTENNVNKKESIFKNLLKKIGI